MVISQTTENIGVIRPLVVSQYAFKVIDLALADKIIVLNNPDQLLDRVVEVQADLVSSVTDALLTSELQLLDQVLVRDLGETATLIGIKVDVINVHGSGIQAQVGQGRVSGDNQFAAWAKLNADLNFMVLQSNQRKGKTDVAVEPELERDPACAARLGSRAPLLKAARVVVFTTEATADHLLVTTALASGDGQVIPDLKPVTELTIDALSSDLNIHALNQVVAKIINPTE